MNFHRIKKILKQEHTLTSEEWKGAVLFLCNEDHIFLIKRSESMPTHSGQMAFVGGHKTSTENTPWETVQREYEEETHHDRSTIEFLGYLPLMLTARLQPIVPVMAKLLIPTAQFLSEVKSNGEWDIILAYPWSEVTQESQWEFAWRKGVKRTPVMFHPIRSGTYLPLEGHHQTHLLWGATASVIWHFLHLYFRP